MSSGSVVVAHVIHSLGVGGVENGVVNLVNAETPGLRHVIVCMTGEGPLRARLDVPVDVYHVGKRRGHDPRAFLTLTRRLRAIDPSIVHSRNWATFDAIIAARLAGVGAVVHGEHGRHITDPEGHNRRRNRLRRLCAPLVSRFVTVSDDLRRWLVDRVGVPAAKVVTIPNGVDTTRFGPGDRRHARGVLGLPLQRTIVGTVGRLDPVKDQGGLVQGFFRVLKAQPDTALVIAGDGPCRAHLEGLVTALDLRERVYFLGERDDVARVLAALDVFVLPSIAEGMSNTVLEAMATGLPVVATRVGGTPELVAHGVTGTLVPPRDPDALAAALVTYVGDAHRRALHGKSAREHAVARFGLERMRNAYRDLYFGAAGCRGA